MKTITTLIDVARKQRLAWSCAIVTALTLIFAVHAPVIPVLAGCAIAIVLTGRRSWPFDPSRLHVRRG